MMIHGIGTDIIEVNRFQKLSERFMERCFTDLERQYLAGKGPESIAGYFAAKEAVVKALGTGFAGFWPSAVEICRGSSGKPVVKLHGVAAEVAEANRIVSVEVSISHCKSVAMAMAIIVKADSAAGME